MKIQSRLFFLIPLLLGVWSVSLQADGSERPPKARIGIPREKHRITAAQKDLLFNRAGISRSQRRHYKIDHVIPLELGGSNATSNLQIQKRDAARRKDRVEKYLAKKVRGEEMSLSTAHLAIRNWESLAPPR